MLVRFKRPNRLANTTHASSLRYMSTAFRSPIFTSTLSRIMAFCGASALTLTAISLVSPSHASEDSVPSEETAYLQPKSFDVNKSFSSFATAAQLMDGAAVVLRPTYTAGLKRTSKVKVVAEDVKVANDRVVGGETYVGVGYGTKSQGFTLHEKMVGTLWPEQEVVFCLGVSLCDGDWMNLRQIRSSETDEWGKVGKVTVTVGEPGEQSTVMAQVYAKCGSKSTASQGEEVAELRCAKSDVVDGGLISYTVRKSGSDSTKRTKAGDVEARTGTNVVIESRGLDFQELQSVASSMTPAIATGSELNGNFANLLVPVWYRSVCAQAIQSGSFDEARRIADEGGTTWRLVSRDFIPFIVTADWNPSRINFNVVGDRVVSCEYG